MTAARPAISPLTGGPRLEGAEFHSLVKAPARLAFLVWTALQGLGAWQQECGFTIVSSFSHLGRALCGVCFWLVAYARLEARIKKAG